MTIRTEEMKEILRIRREDPLEEKNLCMQLLSECADHYTEAFGRTYLGDAYHTLGQMEHALPEYSRALEIAEADGYDDLLSVLYNMIGIVYMYNDDEQRALDYFFSGIRLAEKQQDKMMHATLLSNIAYVYRGAGAFDEAEKMLDESCRMIREARHNDSNVELDELGYELDKIWMLLQKGELEKAWQLMQCDEIREDESRENYINFAIYYAKTSDPEQCLKYIDRALAVLECEINQFERILYLFELIEVSIQACLYEKADEIADMSEQLLVKTGTAGKWTKLMDYRIMIAEALGENVRLDEMYERYYEYDALYEKEKKKAVVKRVRHKMDLLRELDRKSEIEQRQADLYNRRSRDELTGLYNRWGMKQRLESLYQEYGGEAFAFAIVDVDFFKEYNDTYGHVAGDRCLKKVADILESSVGENSIVGRYGGDEFLIAVWDTTKAELEQMFVKIREKLIAINIENKNSKISDRVTITAGGVVTVLDQDMDFSGCLHEADLALYEIKKDSRDGYKVKNLVQEQGFYE